MLDVIERLRLVAARSSRAPWKPKKPMMSCFRCPAAEVVGRLLRHIASVPRNLRPTIAVSARGPANVLFHAAFRECSVPFREHAAVR